MFERTFNHKSKMSPRTKDQFEVIRQKSRENIENIALELFAIKGYHATSISQIAEKAQISKGLLYNYYKSKEHLLNTVITKIYDEIMQIVQMSENLPAEKQIEQMIVETIDHLKKNITLWKLLMFIKNYLNCMKK